jgi:DNA-binding response OmpR family regulator
MSSDFSTSIRAFPDRPTLRALIVEDSPDQRLYLTMALTVAGFEVTALSDGDRTVAEAERLSPALICLDVVLPNLGGLEVCELLRANPATANIPVIITSIRGSALDRAQAEMAGADEFILKPMDPIRFGVRAHELVARRLIVAA